MQNDESKHLREIGAMQAKALEVALQLQAKIYERRLDDLEKEVDSLETTQNRLWGALALLSLLVGWYLAWRK